MKLGEFSQSPNLKRLNEIIKVLSNYEFGYITEKIKLKNIFPSKAILMNMNLLKSLVPLIPIRIRLVLQELGTTFIKLGQTLSTRPYLVGDDIAAELSKLQDDNLPVDFETVKLIIEEELGNSPEKFIFRI